ncbi:hypothetical protein [Desulfoluna sp.]|uniref:hypothetical protein n=1 Tax=Desulfoluna sp. TaxID=2045199 RepID=UPI00261368AF|nr:hypothetical protein [Desulfoluna sp.]
MKRMNVCLVAVLLLLGVASMGMAEAEKETVGERSQHEYQWMSQHGMDETRIQAVVSGMEAQGIQEPEMDAFIGTLRGALEEGLPPEPFMRKAEEGLAKRVQGEVMVKAMERVRERYRYAHAWSDELVPDEGATASVTEIVADAMAAGMEIGDLDTLKTRLRDRDRVKDPALCEESALMLKEMVQLRLRSHTAAEAVGAALDQGYDTADMARFRHMVTSQMGQGDGEGMMHRYTYSIRNGATASELGSSGGHGNSSSGGHSGSGSDGGSSGNSGSSGSSGGNGNGGSGNGRH